MSNCIYNDEDKMWRQAGFVEMLVSPAKRDQNEMGGLQKRGRFKTFQNDIKTRSLMMKTRSVMMKKCRNLKNEIETRWGDSMNLLYCSHIINKSRRSYDAYQVLGEPRKSP